jgi:hypothetical protein
MNQLISFLLGRFRPNNKNSKLLCGGSNSKINFIITVVVVMVFWLLCVIDLTLLLILHEVLRVELYCYDYSNLGF